MNWSPTSLEIGKQYIIHCANVTINTSGHWQHAHQVKDWVTCELLPEIERWLDAQLDERLWIEVAKWNIALDLTALPAARATNSSRSDWKPKLHKQLAQCLQADGNSLKTTQQRETEAWLHFLEYGYLPAIFSSKGKNRLPDIATVAARLSSSQHVKWMQILKKPEAMKRFRDLAPGIEWLATFITQNQTPAFWHGLKFPDAWIQGLIWMEMEGIDITAVASQMAGKTDDKKVAEVLLPMAKQIEAILHKGPLKAIQTLPENWMHIIQKQINLEIPKDFPSPSVNNMMDKESCAATQWKPKERENVENAPLPVENAGLILLAPFLQAYFTHLGLSHTEVDGWSRAPLVLYHLATGHWEAGEWQLVLPKLLCGFPLAANCDTSLKPNNVHTDEANRLLASVIKHWRALKSTSPDGLRINFLQREGWVTLQEDKMVLELSEQAHDILLQFIPWNFRLIKWPWSHRIITVKWGK